VAFVVDDVLSVRPWRVRCLEIRGVAETELDPSPAPGHDSSLIRIRPRRIIGIGLTDPDLEPHLVAPEKRNVG
jgi:pyridoxamine 5'-phosphate oxidase family protein